MRSTLYFSEYSRIGSVALGVDGREVSALLDPELQAPGGEAVQDPKLHVTPDHHGPVTPAVLGINASHGLRTRLQ